MPSPTQSRSAPPPRAARGLALLVRAVFLLLVGTGPVRALDIELPTPDPDEPIQVTADAAHRWRQGVYDVWWLRGNVLIHQGLTYARAQEGVVWIERGGPRGSPPHQVIAYLERGVRVDYQQSPPAGAVRPVGSLAARLVDKKWLGRFRSTVAPEVRSPIPGPEPEVKPAVYLRGEDHRDPRRALGIRPAQFAEPIDRPPAPDAPPLGSRRVRFFPRSDAGYQLSLIPCATPDERILVVTQGINVIIDGLDGFESVDLKTDRAVVWTSDLQRLVSAGQLQQPGTAPLEIYLEGNIEFRQGDRVIEASRMYYDVQRRYGVVLQAELRTPVPRYQGLVRLKADVLQQVDQQRFVAQNAALTSSRLGVPSYEFRAGSLDFVDVQSPRVDPATGLPAADPQTGEPLIDHQFLATSRDNVLRLEGVPVFYWPTLATDLERPTFYVERVRLSNDTVFGTQVLVDFNAYEVFGIRQPPAGTEWTFSTDYLSERGFAAGTNFKYDRQNLFNIPGRYLGEMDLWGLDDDGLDNLGRGQRALQPEEDFRGRVLARHRHFLPDNFQLSAELGLISDRNFLEQYFEEEWDELKDQSTGAELKQYRDNSSWSVSGDLRVNDFFTQTEGGRLDHFWLGEPLLGDRLSWFEHSRVGFADLEVASTPTDPAQAAVFDLLPWEVPSDGLVASTRHELDLPLPVGPLKLTPYVLGEAAHWGQALDGQDLSRLYGQAGIRASLPFWTVDPLVESQFWNVHGLAHKVTLEADLSYADASQDLDELPLYDPLDDDAVEHFRRRFKFTTFGLPAGVPVPDRFDERFYALRSGLQSSVTSPSTEVADDLVAARLGLRQRWQTKRGLPEQRRIVDWITLDTEAVIFPEADRDNFGEDLGLVRYDFAWFLGDRLTLLSEGGFDFFPDGPKYLTLGGYLNRPPRGSLYLGFHSLEGPISAQVLALAYSYRMSPKWISTLSTTVDFGDTGNIGQSLAVTRIGEAFLISFGINVDASKDSVGANFMIEPRIFARSRFGPAGGVQIPPAGAFGLE
jgi:lipopolysaccharide export system protein LptA